MYFGCVCFFCHAGTAILPQKSPIIFAFALLLLKQMCGAAYFETIRKFLAVATITSFHFKKTKC